MNTSASNTIVVTGSSGLIGTALVASLEADGHRVVRAVRGSVKNPDKEIAWDPAAGQIDLGSIGPIDAIVHLAGANIAGRRWSQAYKQELLDSRIQGTQLVSQAVADLAEKPRAFLCASAIGYYGHRGDQELNERISCRRRIPARGLPAMGKCLPVGKRSRHSSCQPSLWCRS